MGYALSTKWNIKRHISPESLLEEILSMGLDAIEIGCNTPSAFLSDCKRLVTSGLMKVSSVHNYCPAPTDRKPDGDSYLLSDTDEALRLEAVSRTRATMEHAADLGAQVVVVHLGRVEMRETTAELKRAHDDGLLTTVGRLSEVERVKLERLQTETPYFEAVLRSIEALVPVAERLGVTLGLENRLRYRQFPLPHELACIFERFDGAPLGYWHDIGHAVFLERLGFVHWGQFLDAMGHRLVGMHIHDVDGLDDHLAPLGGSVDFAGLAKYLRADTLRVLEVESHQTREDIVKGMAYLASMGF